MSDSVSRLALDMALRQIADLRQEVRQLRASFRAALGLLLSVDTLALVQLLDRAVWPIVVAALIVVAKGLTVYFVGYPSQVEWPDYVDLMRSSVGTAEDERRRLVVSLAKTADTNRTTLDRHRKFLGRVTSLAATLTVVLLVIVAATSDPVRPGPTVPDPHRPEGRELVSGDVAAETMQKDPFDPVEIR